MYKQKNSLVCIVGDFSDYDVTVKLVSPLVGDNYISLFSKNMPTNLFSLEKVLGENDLGWDLWTTKENTTAWFGELEDMVTGAKDWFELGEGSVVDVVGSGEHYKELVRKYHRIQDVLRES